MSLRLLSSHTVDVPGNAGAWVPGPVFNAGETLRIRASGSIKFDSRLVYAGDPTSAPFIWSDIAQNGPGNVMWTLGTFSGYSTGKAIIPATNDTYTLTSPTGTLSPSTGLPDDATIVGVELRVTTIVATATGVGTDPVADDPAGYVHRNSDGSDLYSSSDGSFGPEDIGGVGSTPGSSSLIVIDPGSSSSTPPGSSSSTPGSSSLIVIDPGTSSSAPGSSSVPDEPEGGDLNAVIRLKVGGVSYGSTTPLALPAGPALIAIGGNDDLWGRTWSEADLATLTWTLKATNLIGAQRSLGIDGVIVYVYYTLPGDSEVVPMYALPEGAYDPDYPADHPYSPYAVMQTSDWIGSALPATNTVPVSLAAIALPDGDTPAFAGWSNALRPNRDRWFPPATLKQAFPQIADGPYRLWLVFNDGIANYSDDEGSYTAIIDRYVGTPMEPINSLVQPRFEVETGGYGSGGGNASRVLINVEANGLNISDEQTKAKRTTNGFGFSTGEDTTTEISRGSARMMLEYRDIGYVLSGLAGVAKTNVVLSSSLGVSAVRHTWEESPVLPLEPQTYAFEYVKEQTGQNYAVRGMIFNSLRIETARDKQASVSSNVFATVIEDDVTPSTGVNDVQRIKRNGTPTGGTWGIDFGNGYVVTGLAYNAAAGAVQTAVRALGGKYADATVVLDVNDLVLTILSGKFEQLASPIYTDPLTGAVTLTGGTSPTVTITHDVPGGMRLHEFTRCLPNQTSISWADSLAALINAPNLLQDEFETDIEIGDRFSEGWRQNPTDVGHGFITQKTADDLTDTISLDMAYNEVGSQFIAKAKNDSWMFARVRWIGGLIGATGVRMSFTYTAAGQLHWDEIKDSQGNVQALKFTFNVHLHIPTGFRSRFELVNDVLNYQS